MDTMQVFRVVQIDSMRGSAPLALISLLFLRFSRASTAGNEVASFRKVSGPMPVFSTDKVATIHVATLTVGQIAYLPYSQVK